MTTHFLGKTIAYWLDVNWQLARRGYDTFLDGYYIQAARDAARIRELENAIALTGESSGPDVA